MDSYKETIKHLRTDSIKATLRVLQQPGVNAKPEHIKALKAELRRRNRKARS